MKNVLQRMYIGDYVIYFCIVLFAFLCLFPFLYVLSVSFTSPEAYAPLKFIIIPEKLSAKSYEYILQQKSFLRSMNNSVSIALVGTVLSVVCTFTGAYGLSKSRMPGHKMIVSLITFTLVFNAGIVPNYMLIRSLGLINNFWALVLPVLTNAWSMLVVRSFMTSIPAEIEESAKMDGCNDLNVFLLIILPLSKAALATFTLFFIVGYWNSWFNIMLFTTSTDRWTLPLLIKSMVIDNESMGFGVSGADQKTVPQETIKMAAIVLSMLPIIVTYPFLQKYFQKGVMLGSVKG